MLSHKTKDRYWRAFRRKSHRLLQMGYESAFPIIVNHPPEENISGIIAEHCERLLLEGLCWKPEFRDIRIGNERPVNDGKRFGKHRFKIDILIREPHRGRPQAVFAFEAKRLCTGSHPISQYVGADGVGCFLNENYVSDMPEAGMIGYVQNRDIAYWQNQLESKLGEDLEIVEVIPEFKKEWMSVHQRKSGTPINIYHIFLACYKN